MWISKAAVTHQNTESQEVEFCQCPNNKCFENAMYYLNVLNAFHRAFLLCCSALCHFTMNLRKYSQVMASVFLLKQSSFIISNVCLWTDNMLESCRYFKFIRSVKIDMLSDHSATASSYNSGQKRLVIDSL